jgi:hypothetical protein
MDVQRLFAARNNSYFVANAAFLRSNLERLIHLAHDRTRVATPFIGIVTQCKFGANDLNVFWARFFHCPPATPV